MKTVSDSFYRTYFLHKSGGQTTDCHWCRQTLVYRQPEKSPAGKFRGFGRATQGDNIWVWLFSATEKMLKNNEPVRS